MKRPRQFSFSRPLGGMSITMMLVMLALLAMLGLIEIGYLFWAKRDAQKVADLAALAGAQRLELCTSDNSDNSAARQSALTQNKFAGSLQIRCGNWSASRGTANRFVTTIDASNPRNAVQVVAERSVLPFFGQNTSLPTVSVQAVARRSEPTAVFAVGSQLLRTRGDSLLMSTLRLIGLDVTNATVLSYDGLAQANITPSGLLKALNIPVSANLSVADFNRLLAVNKISLAQLVDATATVVGRNTTVGVQLRALSDLVATRLDITKLNIALGSESGGGGLFAEVISPDGTAGSALESKISVLNLISTAISIANEGNGIAVEGLNLLGINVQAGVVEPPSIAIGGVGSRAYNAQVRLMVDVDSNNLFALGPLLQLLGTQLHLPLHVDVANAMGTLTGIQCGASPPKATIQVDSSVLRACVGKVDPAQRFSKNNVCDNTLQNEQLLKLLGKPLITNKIALPALTSSQNLTLAAGESGSTQINPLALGNAVSDLVSELLRVLAGMLSSPQQGMSANDTAKALADRYLQATFPPNTRYDVNKLIPLLRDGDPSRQLAPLNSWTVPDGLPYACGLLNLATCHKDGQVWDAFKVTVTGQGLGVLDGLLGSLVGGLLINRCDSLLGNLLDYNGCVRNNLASYIQTAPAGFLDGTGGSGVTNPDGSVSCSGLLCTLLKPILAALRPVLNSVGSLLTNLLASVLGLELGRTDVNVQSIQCSAAQLVY
ncbi:TadG family pilus assembly protein [Stenotrophomonas maltophilia]|uniref:Membrane protein-like protein n=1 Tax=Stenotrophomonas maltophilia (strain R551-3) TaxID=391008 RepID=B4SLX8_STRM5|nr:TadG family pilus assembly protein [Stenotrophomonas maltophilia]ACF52031.1 membrane protein-like protein [Stenotrophomonas maltophilia R551-3]